MGQAVKSAISDAARKARALLARLPAQNPDVRDVISALAVAEAAAAAGDAGLAGMPAQVVAMPEPHGTGIVPGLAVIPPATAVSAPFNIRWSFNGQTTGLIVGLRGPAAALGTQDLYAFAMREISLQLTINGRELPFIDGQAASFKQFYSTSTPQGSNVIWPFTRRFQSQETWQLAFQTTANFPALVIPYVEFPFLRDDLSIGG
jgi:hypothetical protein